MAQSREGKDLINLALRVGSGPGDSPLEVITFMNKTTKIAGRMHPKDALLLVSERLTHTVQYSSLARNLGRILTNLADIVTEKGPYVNLSTRKILECIMQELFNYVSTIIEETYNFCYTLTGSYLVMGRGILSLACSLGIMDSFEETTLLIPSGHSKEGIFSKLKINKATWSSLYQLAEEGKINGIITQSEVTTPTGALVTHGTFEIYLAGIKRGIQPIILSNPLGVGVGVLPGESQMPLARVKSPDESFEEEYPLLEKFLWKKAGFKEFYILGSKKLASLIEIRRTLNEASKSFVEGVLRRC